MVTQMSDHATYQGKNYYACKPVICVVIIVKVL